MLFTRAILFPTGQLLFFTIDLKEIKPINVSTVPAKLVDYGQAISKSLNKGRYVNDDRQKPFVIKHSFKNDLKWIKCDATDYTVLFYTFLFKIYIGLVIIKLKY